MSITLPEIEAAHTQLGEMIAAFKAQAPTTYIVPEAAFELHKGERYAGLILNDDGTPSHHLILLPEEAVGINWNDAKAWAAKQGGELPTRREQALLFANLKSEFEPKWYWSGEQSSEDCAFSQNFGYGLQGYDVKSYEGRARSRPRRGYG